MAKKTQPVEEVIIDPNSPEEIEKRKEINLQKYKEIRRTVAVKNGWLTEEQAAKSFEKIK